MTASSQSADATRVGNITVSKITDYLHRDDSPSWTLWLTSPRSSLGWVLGDLGNGLARLGNRLDGGVPTIADADGWFEAGARYGYRNGARVYTELGSTLEAMRRGAHLTDEDMAERTGLSVERVRAMQVPTERVTEPERLAWVQAIADTMLGKWVGAVAS